MWRAVMVRLLLLLALPGLMAPSGGCASLLRTFTSYRYKHLRSERKKEPTAERKYMASMHRDTRGWYVRVMELPVCRVSEIDISQETAVHEVRAPSWYWFVGLGGVLTATSTPFWVLAGRSASSAERNKHLLLGSLLFVLPGLTLMGLGAYLKLKSGVRTKDMGLRRRVTATHRLPCGSRAAAKRRVTLGTRTGPRPLGITDTTGRVSVPAEGLRPLVRWSEGKAPRVYFEVFVANAVSVEVQVPKGFPVDPADLKRPGPTP